MQNYKEYILNQTTEEAIFRHYLPDWNGKKATVKNPLADHDTHPSLSIFQHEGGKGWRFKAHNTDHQGDAFQLVADLKGILIKELFTVCVAIAQDMNLIPPEPAAAIDKVWEVTAFPEIQDDGKKYFSQWGITPEVLSRYGVEQVARLINGDKDFDYKKLGWLAIRYRAGKREKIRLPNARDKSKGWIQKSAKGPYLFGYAQVPEGAEALILCEGEKDVLTLAANGFFAVTAGSAQDKVTPAHLERIRAKNCPIFICYDTDEPGRKAAAEIAAKTGFPVIELPEIPGGKDISDYFAAGHTAAEFLALMESAENRAGEKKKSGVPGPVAHGAAADGRPAQGETRKNTGENAQDDKRGAAQDDEQKDFTVFHQAEKYLKAHHNIRNNSIARELEILSKDGTPNKDGDTWEQLNENDLYIEMQKAGIKVSINNLSAILASRSIEQHNPITDYFLNLPIWDGTDHIQKLVSYFDYPDREQMTRDLKKWLIRVVRGVFEPYKYNKQAFVIVHNQQNSGKTHFCRWLTPPVLSKYLSEEFSAEKDGRIALAENLFLMIDELASLNRTDANELKKMFSTAQIKARLPYGKKPVVIPRIASIIGSTNDTNFLKDVTGSVRFLCFEISGINWDYSKDMDINAIWTQAFTLYRQDIPCDMTAEEIEENERRNAPLQAQSTEAEKLPRYVAPAQKGNQGAEFMTSTDILELMQRETILKLSAVNVGRALIAAGFEKVKGPGKIYGYWVRRLKA